MPEVIKFLERNRIWFKHDTKGIKPKFCPLCEKPHKGMADNQYTLNICKTTGIFHCFRCTKSGNWFQFKRLVMQNIYGHYEQEP